MGITPRAGPGALVDLEHLINHLIDLREKVRPSHSFADPHSAVDLFVTPETPLAERARQIYRDRRRRRQFLPSCLLGEPAYDILLDLYVCGVSGRKVSITDACIAADVPGTTALRWIASIVDEGLAERAVDPVDRRRSYLSLTATGRAKMAHHLMER